MRMRTSVVIGSYNGSHYIIEQLESIKNQTQKVDEVVICDDCSKDNTVEIVNQYIKDNQLSGWTICENEKNLGYESNFYKALYMATGDYIFFCDQDDVWMKNKVEVTCSIMEKQKNIELLCSDFEAFRTSDHAPTIPIDVQKRMTNDKSLEKVNLDAYNIFIRSLGCVMCIRKTFADEIKPYWFDGWAQDEFVWKMALCKDGCYIYHANLIRRRLHEANVSMRKIHELEKRIIHLQKLLKSNEACLQYVQQNNYSVKYIRLIEKNIKSEKLRLDLLQRGKILNTFILIFYGKYYYSKKSLLMEPLIKIKNK